MHGDTVIQVKVQEQRELYCVSSVAEFRTHCLNGYKVPVNYYTLETVIMHKMTPKLQQQNPAFFWEHICQIPAEAQMPRSVVAVTWTLCQLEKELWSVAQWVKIAFCSLQEFPLVEACLSYKRGGLNIWLHLTTAIPQGGDTQ